MKGLRADSYRTFTNIGRQISYFTAFIASVVHAGSISLLNNGKIEQPNFLSNVLYIRAFQLAGIMNAEGVLATRSS